jgi:prepilin-type N-terminal cleavage/methylation domain-containing protein
MRNEKGFTLIELLVVIAIIGILAAIAIPQFQQYRQRGYDAGARSDLRNAATAEEAYFIDADTYVSCASSAACVTTLDGLQATSATVDLAMTGTATAFTGTATASAGSGVTYSWDSDNGGMQ